MGRRELPDSFEEGVLGMIEASPVEVVEDRALVWRGPEASRQQALDLGGEGEAYAVPVVVERFHSHAVPRAEEPAAISVPDGEREHPIEARDTELAPLPVGCEQDLRVRRRAEPVAFLFQLVTKFNVIVDLTVVGDPTAAVFRRHRLMAE